MIANLEREFQSVCDENGWIIPHTLQPGHWQAYFLNDESWMTEANKWLTSKLNGYEMKVVDDVDRRRMKYSPELAPKKRTGKGWYWSAWDDEEYHWQGWQGTNWFKRGWTVKTPKIAAPSGLSGVLAEVF